MARRRDARETLQKFEETINRADDDYLRSMGYYRQFSPTVADSLFRTVALLNFGLTKYQNRVREECVEYMRVNRRTYAKRVSIKYSTYLQRMRQHSTPGTLLELHALVSLYRAKVFIIEPFCRGDWFVSGRDSHLVWRIFYDSCSNRFYPVWRLRSRGQAVSRT